MSFSFHRTLLTSFPLRYCILAKLITDEQHEAVKKQRVLEIQNRKEIYQWGDDPNFIGFPGFIKSESVRTLPKDVRFTEEAIDDLYHAKRKALLNLGLVKLLNMFESWEDFHDYKKVNTPYLLFIINYDQCKGRSLKGKPCKAVHRHLTILSQT